MEKEVTSVEREKTRTNPVVWGQSLRYWYKVKDFSKNMETDVCVVIFLAHSVRGPLEQ